MYLPPLEANVFGNLDFLDWFFGSAHDRDPARGTLASGLVAPLGESSSSLSISRETRNVERGISLQKPGWIKLSRHSIVTGDTQSRESANLPTGRHSVSRQSGHPVKPGR